MKSDVTYFAKFYHGENGVGEKTIGVHFPDLDCSTFGMDEAEALFMAKECMELWIQTEKNIAPPSRAEDISLEPGEWLVEITGEWER
jgi:predicted RNase H-like HicB family nuclease